MSASSTLHAARRRSRFPRDAHRTVEPFSVAAVAALRVFGDVRTRRVKVDARGYEYRLVTDRGEDLLAPSPHHRLRFLFFCAAFVRAANTNTPIALGEGLRAALAALARGDDPSAFGFDGEGFGLRTRLSTPALTHALAEMTRDALVWMEAGEREESAIREVIADSYRRHRRELASAN